MGHGPRGPIGHLPGPGRGGPTCGGHAGRGGGPGGGPGGPGAGGAGGAPGPMLCTGTPPATPGITGPSSLVAATFVYSAPNLIAPTIEPIVATDGSFSGLTVTAAPGATTDPANAWQGVGMVLPGCIDASAYTGVRFTIAGDLGTCSIGFVAVPTEKNADEFGGACTLDSCFSPASAPLPIGTSTVHFADLVGGSPDGPVDPARLMGVQWQLQVPSDGVTAPCTASFTITDVAFVTDEQHRRPERTRR